MTMDLEIATPRYGWGRSRSVREGLFAESYRFEFFQAVHLLEMLALTDIEGSRQYAGRSLRYHDPVLPKGVEPLDLITLRAEISFAFPPSEVKSVRLTSAKPFSAELVTPLLALAGARGPLPDVYAELVLERLKYRDTALRDFLDLFHHRFLVLLYQAEKRKRLWMESQEPENSRFASYLLCFAGAGELPAKKAEGELPPPRHLMAYAGLLWHQPRSSAGLQQLLSGYFQMSCKVHQLRGAWTAIEPEDCTRLGITGGNQILGVTATLGTQFWNSQAGFDIELRLPTLAAYESFLPTGKNYRDLCLLTRFYAGMHMCFHLLLILETPAAPELTLGSSRLGWSSWLRSGVKRKTKTIRVSSNWKPISSHGGR